MNHSFLSNNIDNKKQQQQWGKKTILNESISKKTYENYEFL